MWHHKSWFGGGWIFWIIMIMAFSGAFGNGGSWGFMVPLMIFWVIGAAFSGAKHGQRRRRWMRFDPHLSEPVPRRDGHSHKSYETRSDTGAPRPLVQRQAAEPVTRNLSGLPGHCKSCGGPVDGTTVEWRGSDAVCGFCGSGLKRTD